MDYCEFKQIDIHCFNGVDEKGVLFPHLYALGILL